MSTFFFFFFWEKQKKQIIHQRWVRRKLTHLLLPLPFSEKLAEGATAAHTPRWNLVSEEIPKFVQELANFLDRSSKFSIKSSALCVLYSLFSVGFYWIRSSIFVDLGLAGLLKFSILRRESAVWKIKSRKL